MTYQVEKINTKDGEIRDGCETQWDTYKGNKYIEKAHTQEYTRSETKINEGKEILSV